MIVDLPEPDGPQITTSSSRGMSKLMFLRLCCRAFSIWMQGLFSVFLGSYLSSSGPLGKLSFSGVRRLFRQCAAQAHGQESAKAV